MPGLPVTDLAAVLPLLAAMAGGLFMLVAPARSLAHAELVRQRALDARIARGSDSYFEELRALKAYRPSRSLLRRRLSGGLLLGAGAAGLIAFAARR
jgi:hypothetical protein